MDELNSFLSSLNTKYCRFGRVYFVCFDYKCLDGIKYEVLLTSKKGFPSVGFHSVSSMSSDPSSIVSELSEMDSTGVLLNHVKYVERMF